MIFTFGRKEKTRPVEPRIPFVLVRQASLLPSADPYDLMQDVVNFINHATLTAHFTRDELPQDALRAFHVDFYVQQVRNGGHGQFAANSGWDEMVLKDIREGLARIDLPEASAIFTSLLTFAQAEPAQFRATREGGGFGKIRPFIDKIDQRFFDEVNDDIEPALRRFMTSWPFLRALDDEAYRAEMRALPHANSDAASRAVHIERQVKERQAADPIHQALRYVCHLAPSGLEFKALLAAHPFATAENPDVTGTVFRVETALGMAQIMFVDDRAAIVMQDEVCARVPLAMVEAFLNRQGLTLPGSVLRGELH